jgi:ABC-2 type transport system ATP-binding protein
MLVSRYAVALRDVHVRYGTTSALDGVSFQAGTGVTGLLGPNGAGKTTLLRLLATVAAPDSGQVRLLGGDPGNSAERVGIRRRLGYMPQEPGFHPHFTVFAFVDYIAVLKELTERRRRHTEVRRVLDLVGLTAVRHKKIKALSGGMRRRVALAQALLGEPELLVLDEPTAGLDPEQRLHFRELISNLAERRTVVLSTHQTEDVAALCQHVVVLDKGAVRFAGSPEELAARAGGHVWTSGQRGAGTVVSWRTSSGAYRNLGDPPAGAALIEPTLEDGYLLLIGDRAALEVA